MSNSIIDCWCKKYILCRGCKFIGNECVVRDGETGNNSKFYDRMTVLVNAELSKKNEAAA
jgi:hypothetical protein